MATTLGSTGITFPDSTTQTTAAQSGGMTLLGTLTTTSGTSQTLSGLNLTSYNSLYIIVNGVSTNAAAVLRLCGYDISINYAGLSFRGGFVSLNLKSNVTSYTSCVFIPGGGGNAIDSEIPIASLSSSSTSIFFDTGSSNTFDAGTILVYGVK